MSSISNRIPDNRFSSRLSLEAEAIWVSLSGSAPRLLSCRRQWLYKERVSWNVLCFILLCIFVWSYQAVFFFSVLGNLSYTELLPEMKSAGIILAEYSRLPCHTWQVQEDVHFTEGEHFVVSRDADPDYPIQWPVGTHERQRSSIRNTESAHVLVTTCVARAEISYSTLGLSMKSWNQKSSKLDLNNYITAAW